MRVWPARLEAGKVATDLLPPHRSARYCGGTHGTSDNGKCFS